MYIATMYSYGMDNDCVGVDGIDSCMGVFLVYDRMMFAIHVPNNSSEVNEQGKETFVTFIKKQIPKYKGSNARLYAVVNNISRGKPGAEDEVRGYITRLKPAETVFTRLRDNVSGVAAAVLCELAPIGSRGVALKYQPHATAGWQNNSGGTPRSGSYKNHGYDGVFSVSSTSGVAGWVPVNISNSDMTLLKV